MRKRYEPRAPPPLASPSGHVDVETEVSLWVAFPSPDRRQERLRRSRLIPREQARATASATSEPGPRRRGALCIVPARTPLEDGRTRDEAPPIREQEPEEPELSDLERADRDVGPFVGPNQRARQPIIEGHRHPTVGPALEAGRERAQGGRDVRSQVRAPLAFGHVRCSDQAPSWCVMQRNHASCEVASHPGPDCVARFVDNRADAHLTPTPAHTPPPPRAAPPTPPSPSPRSPTPPRAPPDDAPCTSTPGSPAGSRHDAHAAPRGARR